MNSFVNRILVCGVLLGSFNYSNATDQNNFYEVGIENNKSSNFFVNSNKQISSNGQVGKYDRTIYCIDDSQIENGDRFIRKGNIIARYNDSNNYYKVCNKNCYPCGNNNYQLYKNNNKLYLLDNTNNTRAQIMNNFPSQLDINTFSLIYNNEIILINLDANNAKYNIEYNDNDNTTGIWQISNRGGSPFAKYNGNEWILISSGEELQQSNFDNKKDNIVKYVQDDYGIYLCNQILAKYNTNDNKWYKTDTKGNITNSEFYKTALTIDDDNGIKLENNDNQFYFYITKLGKLINNGSIIIGKNCTLVLPEYNIQYLYNDFAVDNTHGKMIFEDNGNINNLLLDSNKYSVIKGGDIYINKLIDWDNISTDKLNEKIENNGKNIKSAFYNATIHLFPEKLDTLNNITEFFSTNDNFVNNRALFFPNMKFLPDIKQNNKVIEVRHSEIPVPNIIEVIQDNNKYGTEDNVIAAGFNGINNILKLFYRSEEINSNFKSNPPLVMNLAKNEVPFNEFLKNPSKYNKDLSNITGYKLDLPSFNNNSEKYIIDYNQLNESEINNLKKIQLVSSSNIDESKLNLLLLPKYIDSNGMKLFDNTLDMSSTYANWRGVITIPNTIARIILKGSNEKNTKSSYIIKAHDYMAIQTVGNIDLIFANNGTLNLYELSNNDSNNTLSISQYSKNNENSSLKINVLESKYNVPELKVIAPVQLETVNQDILMSSASTYHKLYKLIYDCIKTPSNNIDKTLFQDELKNISKYLTEIEDPNSTTDYAKYFKAMKKNGEIPYSLLGIKPYSKIAHIQDNLIKINNFKVKILDKYLKVLEMEKSKINEEQQKNEFDSKYILSITNKNNGTLTIAKNNQIKMLSNKWRNSSYNDRKILEKEIDLLTGNNARKIMTDKLGKLICELENINSKLSEIYNPHSTTDYAKYFQAMNGDGLIENDTTDIKSYNEISTQQDELIKINNFKLEILREMIKTLTEDKHVALKYPIGPKKEIEVVLSAQIKMLKNKWNNDSDSRQTTLFKDIMRLESIMYKIQDKKELNDLDNIFSAIFKADIEQDEY